ncbi:hypothetical protein AB0C02_31005 [Micromonospora sp. NPDC048999]|uniref:hypothetical protein n=1 Tax=Micromonospora sp. NPDC048999 TaxID=3155391 RepID=UPI0033D9D37C
MDQLTPDGRIVACLPITAQPSTTLIATITLTAGRPHVEAITFGGYAQSTAVPVDDALTIPARWVDCILQQPEPAWISIGWRDRDDRQRSGARATLNLLLHPGHSETYARVPLDWQSWTAYSVIAGGHHRSIAALRDGIRGIGHTTETSAAMILTDSTIIADSSDSSSLAALRTWLDQWERVGRPAANWFNPTLVLNDDDLPGWDLRINNHPGQDDGQGRIAPPARSTPT